VSSPVAPTYYADFGGLESLKSGVKADDPKAIKAAAQQFESLFTNMMLKSMREAKLGKGLGDSQESDLYQDMYDQQIALKMSQGKGLGLADMLLQQLTRNRAARTGADNATTPAIPASTTAPTPAPAPTTSQRIGFVKSMEPYAQQAAKQLGVAADTLIAQAALETGWGQHVPTAGNGASSSNLFGVKAGSSWGGDSVNSLTTEVVQGHAGIVPQSFRSYSSVQEGVNDYVTLLQRNSRYSQVLGTGSDVNAFATGMARGGYATDPDYVQKLAATAQSVKALRASSAHEPLKLLAGVPTTAGGES
jgi:peptidoglycan hydrolase FlgJ